MLKTIFFTFYKDEFHWGMSLHKLDRFVNFGEIYQAILAKFLSD